MGVPVAVAVVFFLGRLVDHRRLSGCELQPRTLALPLATELSSELPVGYDGAHSPTQHNFV